jgi:hypothetical protein
MIGVIPAGLGRTQTVGRQRGNRAMSLFGALRLYAIVKRDGPASPKHPELSPIRPEAWSAWAQASQRPELLERPLGEVCRTPDGRMGQVVAVFDGGEWRRTCHVVQAAAT